MTFLSEVAYADLETCQNAEGVVVVIDVCRAFTTAAFAFAAGAERILLAGTVEEALALKASLPDALAMGEAGGAPVEGFDLWNSPAQFEGLELRGRTLVQRTSAGTQGVVRSQGAAQQFAASFVVAGATARAVRAVLAAAGQPARVTFVNTGVRPSEGHSDVEDVACADYLAALLRDQQPDPEKYLFWMAGRRQGSMTDAPTATQRQFEADVALCGQVDRFDFAMYIQRKGKLFEMRPILPPFDALLARTG